MPSADADSLFRTDLFLDAFASQFHPLHPQLRANARARWVAFMRAARSGTLLQRPDYAPKWRARLRAMPPMFDRLQSSNDDCEYELDVMQSEALRQDPNCKLLLCGGDGLWIIRMTHLLSRKRQSPSFQN